ncbi:MAG: hypothetical protein K8T90_09490 [Planctomycetes bacterium]|nr:hypothetical protein [Planctomycetota bacterium]
MPERKDVNADAREAAAHTAVGGAADAASQAACPDAVERLRVALWCPEEPRPTGHAAACEPCTAELIELRRIREILVAARSSAPSPEAVRAVDHAFANGLTQAASAPANAPADDEPAMDFTWLRALPAFDAAAGVRGMACDGLMRCSTDDLQLDLLLGSDLSGQVLAPGDEPCPGVEVTLFLDRRPAGAVRTDRFGEFSLEIGRGRRARSIGVSVVGRGKPRHVEVWRAEENS